MAVKQGMNQASPLFTGNLSYSGTNRPPALGQWSVGPQLQQRDDLVIVETRPVDVAAQVQPSPLHSLREVKTGDTGIAAANPWRYVMKFAIATHPKVSSHSVVLHETAILHRFDDPNIIPVLDAGTDSGFDYLVTPRIQGCTVGEVLRNRGSSPFLDRLAIARQLVNSMIRLHSAGWCHVDLHPDNLMIDEVCHLTVIDFGYAKPIGFRFPSPASLGGYRRYRAPEFAQGLQVVQPSLDRFAIGILVLELLSFVGKSPTTAIKQSSVSEERRSKIRKLRDISDPKGFSSVALTGLDSTQCKFKEALTLCLEMTSPIVEERPELGSLANLLMRLEIELLEKPNRSKQLLGIAKEFQSANVERQTHPKKAG